MYVKFFLHKIYIFIFSKTMPYLELADMIPHEIVTHWHIEDDESKRQVFCRRHFPMYFLNYNCSIFKRISINLLPEGPADNMSVLVLMAWRWI